MTADTPTQQHAQQQHSQQTQPRGAGTGEKANASRENLVDWPPEPKPHQEHVDELLQQAQDNEDYNNEINAAQVEQLKKIQEVVGHPQGDPVDNDKAREEAKEAFINSTDPKKKEAALKGEMEARAKRDKAQAAAATGSK